MPRSLSAPIFRVGFLVIISFHGARRAKLAPGFDSRDDTGFRVILAYLRKLESAEATIRMLAGWKVRADRVTGDKEHRAEPYAAQV
jgi:hypothetical protein